MSTARFMTSRDTHKKKSCISTLFQVEASISSGRYDVIAIGYYNILHSFFISIHLLVPIIIQKDTALILGKHGITAQ